MKRNQNVIEAFTEMAPRYETVVDAELSRFWGWSYPSFVTRLAASLPLFGGGRILDVATGTGSIPQALQSRGAAAARLHGLDITFAMLARARGLTQQPLPLVCASAMSMPSPIIPGGQRKKISLLLYCSGQYFLSFS